LDGGEGVGRGATGMNFVKKISAVDAPYGGMDERMVVTPNCARDIIKVGEKRICELERKLAELSNQRKNLAEIISYFKLKIAESEECEEVSI
jgi:hypothetical protein